MTDFRKTHGDSIVCCPKTGRRKKSQRDKWTTGFSFPLVKAIKSRGKGQGTSHPQMFWRMWEYRGLCLTEILWHLSLEGQRWLRVVPGQERKRVRSRASQSADWYKREGGKEREREPSTEGDGMSPLQALRADWGLGCQSKGWRRTR